MKITLLIFTFLLLLRGNIFAQDYWHTESKNLNSNTFRKGKITLSDGKSIKFKNLSIGENVISYTDMLGQHQEQQKSEVFKITKTGNYADVGIIIGALSGALTGVQWDRALDEAWGEDIDRTNLILLCTISGAAIDGLIGLMFKKEKNVYKNNAALSFYPSLNKTQTGTVCPMLSLKINLK